MKIKMYCRADKTSNIQKLKNNGSKYGKIQIFFVSLHRVNIISLWWQRLQIRTRALPAGFPGFRMLMIIRSSTDGLRLLPKRRWSSTRWLQNLRTCSPCDTCSIPASCSICSIRQVRWAMMFIIAHAITEHLPLISSDGKFDFYCKQGLNFIFNKK